MRRILTPGNRPVLERFSRSKVLLAFDYDGTLAPIVADPTRAQLRTRTRQRLAELAARYPCVVISGRARADTRSRLEGLGIVGVVGNHGLEGARAQRRFARHVARWRPRLETLLRPHRGVEIEDKIYSISVHYRRARHRREAREAVLHAVATLGPVRIVGGKQVVNLLPDGAPHKGDALERERKRLRCDTAIYTGDDDTDEDVFRLDHPATLLTIRVGARRSSRASYCLRDQREIDALLGTLSALRAP